MAKRQVAEVEVAEFKILRFSVGMMTLDRLLQRNIFIFTVHQKQSWLEIKILSTRQQT